MVQYNPNLYITAGLLVPNSFVLVKLPIANTCRLGLLYTCTYALYIHVLIYRSVNAYIQGTDQDKVASQPAICILYWSGNSYMVSVTGK